MVVVGLPKMPPKMLSTVLEIVTPNSLSRAVRNGTTVVVPATGYPLRDDTWSAFVDPVSNRVGMLVTPASAAASAALWTRDTSTYQRPMSRATAVSTRRTTMKMAVSTATAP